MAGAGETEFDAVVHQAFALQASAGAGLDQQVDRSLLQNAGANALLDVFARVGFEHDGIDALQIKKMGKRESGGACSDNSNLGSHQ